MLELPRFHHLLWTSRSSFVENLVLKLPLRMRFDKLPVKLFLNTKSFTFPYFLPISGSKENLKLHLSIGLNSIYFLWLYIFRSKYLLKKQHLFMFSSPTFSYRHWHLTHYYYNSPTLKYRPVSFGIATFQPFY